MIAYPALVLTDTFAPRFASIHSVMDSVEFLENSEVILAKFFKFLGLYVIFEYNSLLYSDSVKWDS